MIFFPTLAVAKYRSMKITSTLTCGPGSHVPSRRVRNFDLSKQVEPALIMYQGKSLGSKDSGVQSYGHPGDNFYETSLMAFIYDGRLVLFRAIDGCRK